MPKMKMGRSPLKVPPLGTTKHPGERKFIVSVASPKGGGRQIVFASSPVEAANKATSNLFLRGRFPKGVDVIVTDTTKKKDSQSFFGPSPKGAVFSGAPLKKR